MARKINNKSFYKKLIDREDYNNLEEDWKIYDLERFNRDINLYDYQKEALEKITLFLNQYYGGWDKTRQQNLKEGLHSKLKNLPDSHKILNSLRKKERKSGDKSIFKILSEYYEEESGEISETNFLNRASIEMATGSGKTLVIIKLIELLHKLKESELIPKNKILILTWNDTLVEQIKKEIKTYNQDKLPKEKIVTIDLKRSNPKSDMGYYGDNIKVFLYRTNLIGDKEGDKRLSFERLDENDGKWFIILDEAHKGDTNTSKAQNYFSILSRNGFLFNFSATLTDDIDNITTIYDFNLEKFITKGHGKNIYLPEQKVLGFKKGENEEFNEKQKQLIILKTLINLTLIKKAKAKIKNLKYHNPLMVGFVGRTLKRERDEEPDLVLLFNEIRKILRKEIDPDLFQKAKEELEADFSDKQINYLFSSEKFEYSKEAIRELQVKDILKEIFYTDRRSELDIVINPKEKDEVVFKARNSKDNKHFCLINIGKIQKFLEANFGDSQIIKDQTNQRFFDDLKEDDNETNILLGSRKFYEGWNSNRPNVMLFINIGKNGEKYIKQAIGRGVRIEPTRNDRQRLKPDSYGANKKQDINLIESLFVYGTDKKEMQATLESFKKEDEEWLRLDQIEKNPDIKEKILLIPAYKEVEEIVDFSKLKNVELNKKLAEDYLNFIGESEVLLFNKYYDVITKSEKMEISNFKSEVKAFLRKASFKSEETENGNLESNIDRILNYINKKNIKFDKFKKLDEEIIHFKKIVVNKKAFEEFDELKEKVRKVVKFKKMSYEEIDKKFDSGEITREEYKEKIKEIGECSKKESLIGIKIEKFENHFYIPILYSKQKLNYIKHIIKEESEYDFLMDLSEYTTELDKQFDYWYFSKIDETIDFKKSDFTDGPIPYLDSYPNLRKFKPDFVFWCKKGKDYKIIFIDPKGQDIGGQSSIYKYEKFEEYFKENSKIKEFKHNNMKVKVHLFYYNKEKPRARAYENYWRTDLEQIFEEVLK